MLNIQYLRRRAAAHYLTERGFAISAQTLARMAVDGSGPNFVKFGRWVLYAPEELIAWANNRCGTPQRSTSSMPSRAAVRHVR